MEKTFVIKCLMSNGEVKTCNLHAEDFEDTSEWSTGEIFNKIKEDLGLTQDELDEKFVKILNDSEMCSWLDYFTHDKGGMTMTRLEANKEILAMLSDLAETLPDMRLGQLLCITNAVKAGTNESWLYYAEPEDMLKRMKARQAEVGLLDKRDKSEEYMHEDKLDMSECSCSIHPSMKQQL